MLRGRLVVACIPAYNEQDTIVDVVKGAHKHVDIVVVCDDGSTDSTYKRAKAAGAIVIRHPRNMGYGAALRTLFMAAKKLNPDVMITLDGDGQHDPSYIPELIRPVLDGHADIVVGSRMLKATNIPSYRILGIKMITWFVRIAAYPTLNDAQSGFRAYSRRAVQVLDVTERGMGASTEILVKASTYGLRIKEVPIEINYTDITPRINPLRHGMSVLLATIKFIARKYLGAL